MQVLISCNKDSTGGAYTYIALAHATYSDADGKRERKYRQRNFVLTSCDEYSIARTHGFLASGPCRFPAQVYNIDVSSNSRMLNNIIYSHIHIVVSRTSFRRNLLIFSYRLSPSNTLSLLWFLGKLRVNCNTLMTIKKIAFSRQISWRSL